MRTFFNLPFHRPQAVFTWYMTFCFFCTVYALWGLPYGPSSSLSLSEAFSSTQADSAALKETEEEAKKTKPTTFRSDLASLLGSTLCQSHFSTRNLHQAKDLISRFSFDAGAKLAYLNLRSSSDPAAQTEINTGKQQKIKALQTYAESQAQKEHHLGAAWGVCSGDDPTKTVGWIITTPSAYPWNHDNLDQATASHCRWHELLMTSAISPKPISWHQWRKAMEDKDSISSVSFRCFPKHPHWLGPVMWFLKAPHSPAPAIADVRSHAFSEASGNKHPEPLSVISVKGIVTAIDNIRLANRLPPLLHRQGDFDKISAQLATHHALTHHHEDLSRLASVLPREVKTLTELRVIASTNQQAAKLLLASPSHRSAFMNPSARWISVNIRSISSSQSQVVIILGHN